MKLILLVIVCALIIYVKASEFEQLSALTTVERKEEEQLCDHFITAARQRHQAIASRLKEKFLAMMINDKTAYLNSSRLFWKLDSWEDDLRRRRRLIRNPTGIIHDEIIQNGLSSNETNDDMITTVIKEEHLLKQFIIDLLLVFRKRISFIFFFLYK